MDEQPLNEFVHDLGIEVFGNWPDFNKWLSCSMLALKGKSPKELPLEDLYKEILKFKNDNY